MPRIVLQREPHRGKGGAVKAGLLAATEPLSLHLRRRSVDAGRRAAAVPAAGRSTDFDVAIGSREGHGARRIGEPLIRHLAGPRLQLRACSA